MRASGRGLLRNWRIHLAAVLSLGVAFGVTVFAMSLFDALRGARFRFRMLIS